MTTATNGQICFGIRTDEDYEFPWDAEKWDGDIEEWWRVEVHGYKPPFELFDEEGMWINGVEQPDGVVREYFKHRRIFDEEHPAIPVELVNDCSNEYHEYIVAVPSTFMVARRGYPKEFNPLDLVVDERQLAAFTEFCVTYLPDLAISEARWYLSSYWG